MAVHDLHAEAHSSFAETLRAWRRARGVSQLDLALTTGVSARHLSFLETGRARPSRDMAAALADALVLPRAARNALLTSAGFAPLYPTTPLQAAALEPFRAILDAMIDKHDPNPAFVCDRHWNVLRHNKTGAMILAPLSDGESPLNMARLMADPRAAALIENYGEVLVEFIARVRLETLESGPDAVQAAHLAHLECALRAHGAPKAANPRRPIVPIRLKTPLGPLQFLTAVAQFGTSEDVTVRDLRLELFFPMDETTKAAMAALG